MHAMFKISRRLLRSENFRTQISKYCFSNSKSKKTDNYKITKKITKNRQYKTKTVKLSTANVVMEAFNIDKTDSIDVDGKNNEATNTKFNFPLAYSKYRRWEAINKEKNFDENDSQLGTKFTLLSYNILAQDLLEEHSYIYNDHDKKFLDWFHRLSKLTEEILFLKPDIICFQEVQNNHLDILKFNLDILNCECIYKKKTGERTDGCAIFYNKDKFILKESKSIEFFQPNVEKLDKENVGLVVKLSSKQHPGNDILIATTHLLYNPKRQDIRLAQIQLLLAELDHLSFKGSYENNIPERFPIILTGDFNLKPFTAPYKLLTSGELEYSKLTRLRLENPDNNFISSKNSLVGNNFLPSHLGITDNCQHIDVVSNNYKNSSRLHHSENQSKNTGYNTNNLIETHPQLFSTGSLKHVLNLKSAYDHFNKFGKSYVSTYQNEWVTVDYIFYSTKLNSAAQTFNENNLILLSRYALPTIDQCYNMGMIPNCRLGSDHLALAVNFLLKISETSDS